MWKPNPVNLYHAKENLRPRLVLVFCLLYVWRDYLRTYHSNHFIQFIQIYNWSLSVSSYVTYGKVTHDTKTNSLGIT